MDRPDPSEYQPPLRWWSHVWRSVLVLIISGAVWLSVAERQSEEVLLLDLVVGVPAVVLMFFRRRWPVLVAVVTTLAGAVSSIAAGPATLAAVSLATRRRWREVVPIAVLGVVCAELFVVVQPDPEGPRWLTLTTNVVAISAMMAWGMYIGSRRELIWTLRQRAERAEAEQELRVGQARSAEQARIAREMHDVLAHRISQISLHAGALAYRDGLSAEETRTSAEVIRDKAHEALDDLRGVLGVLRDDATGERTHAPQPTYADLADLVAEARESGTRVELEDLVEGDDVPEATGRTVYRIVQEGITNVRKHAPGALLTVRMSGGPDTGIEVLLRNPVGFGPSRTPGSGLGLIGLVERAELRGGRLDHGRDGSSFVLHGWIPWAP